MPLTAFELPEHSDELRSDMLAGSLDKTMRLWRPENGECLHVLMQSNAPTFCILALSSSPHNRADWVAATRTGVITFWKESTLQKTIELGLPVTSLAEVVGENMLLAGTGKKTSYRKGGFLELPKDVHCKL